MSDPTELHVLRPERYMDIERLELDYQSQKTAMLEDLTEIKRLAARLHSSGKGAPTVAQKQDHETLRRKLNFGLPVHVLELEDDWYEVLTTGIDHDEALLQETSAEAVRRGFDESQLRLQDVTLGSQPIELPPGGPAASPSAEQQAYEKSDAARQDSWRGYLQVRTAELLGDRLAATDSLLGVRVAPGEPMPLRRRAQATGRVWESPDQTRRGLWVELQVPDSELHSAVARLWIETPALPSGWLGRLRGRSDGRYETQLWQSLNRPRRLRELSLLQEIAGVIDLVMQIRRRDLSLLLQAVDAYKGGPTTLLRDLAAQHEELGRQPRKTRQRVLEILPEVLRVSDWPGLRQNILPLAEALSPAPPEATALYLELHRRAPQPPAASDLEFLTTAASSLELKADPSLELVTGSLAYLAPNQIQGDVACQLHRLLRPSSGGGVVAAPPTAAVIQAIVERMAQRRRQGQLQTALNDLESLAGTLVHLERIGEWQRLMGHVGGWLAEDCPGSDPEVWQLRERYAELLDAVAAFQRLVLLGPSSTWDVAFFEEQTRWLPQVPEPATDPSPKPAQRPSQYPSTFWPLLRLWLLQQPIERRQLAAFQAEIAGWYLSVYCTDGEHSPPLKDLLRECGRWLTQPKPDPWIYVRLTRQAVDRFLDAQQSPDAERPRQLALEGLCLLCAPDRAQGIAFDGMSSDPDSFDAIYATFDLEPWRQSAAGKTARDRRLTESWSTWISLAVADDVSSGSTAWMAAWAQWTLLGVVCDDEARLAQWQAHLGRFDGSQLRAEDWNAHLDQIDSVVRSGILQWRRLEVLATWLTSRSTPRGAGQPLGHWREWVDEAQQNGWIDPKQAVWIFSAALRREDPGRLEELLLGLWPRVPVQLLRQGDQGKSMFRFLALCAQIEETRSEEARLSVARQVLSAGKPGSRDFDTVSLMAEVLFRSKQYVPQAADLADWWGSLAAMSGLNDTWKWKFARKLFTAPLPKAREDFYDEICRRIAELLDRRDFARIVELAGLVASPRGKP